MNFTLDPSAITQIRKLCAAETQTFFRISVDSGGCSGFSYVFGFAGAANPDDTVIDDLVVIDATSQPFLENSVLSFKDDLSGQQFIVKNPNATGGCGCGVSFAV